MSLICFNSKDTSQHQIVPKHSHFSTLLYLLLLPTTLSSFATLDYLSFFLLSFLPLYPSRPVSLSCSLLVSIVLKGDISAFSAVPGILTHSSLAFQQPVCYLGLYCQII